MFNSAVFGGFVVGRWLAFFLCLCALTFLFLFWAFGGLTFSSTRIVLLGRIDFWFPFPRLLFFSFFILESSCCTLYPVCRVRFMALAVFCDTI